MTTATLRPDLFAACSDCGGEIPMGRVLDRKDRKVSDASGGDASGSAAWDVVAPGLCAACGSGRVRVHFQI